MGNLTSKTLSLDAVNALQFSPYAHVQERDITSAVKLIWAAFREQNPSRDDEAVFVRRQDVLLEVFYANWQFLSKEQRQEVWEEWRSFLALVLKREIRDPHVLDILGLQFADEHLPETSRVYYRSWETAEALLVLLADYNLKPVFCWASTTQEWCYHVWDNAAGFTKKMIVKELWTVVNGLAREKDEHEKGKKGYQFGELTGYEEMFQDRYYSKFPALASLLRIYQKTQRAEHTPYIVRFDGGKHLSNQIDPKREWRLDRQERERKEGSSSRHRTRSSSPRRTPSPSAGRLLHTAYHNVDHNGRLIHHSADDELSAALNGIHLGSTSTTAPSHQHRDGQNALRNDDQELSAAFERVNLNQYHNLSHVSPYSRRQRHIYRM